jgi:CheY-like chemotaxis protein
MTTELLKTIPALLIAEDKIMLRAIAVEMLCEAGLTVFEVDNGLEALVLLQRNPQIGLLISDIKMPRLNGYELCAAGLALMPDLRVLLLTGYSDILPSEELWRFNIRILHKPFDLEQLCAIAEEMLGGT